MQYGVLIVSSVGGIKATFSSCDTPIGSGGGCYSFIVVGIRGVSE